MSAAVPESIARPPNENEISAKQRLRPILEQDRARWMLDQPFLGALAMRLELVPIVDFRIPTAATDGERIFFNAHFAESLDAETRRFVLAHEVWHCATLHVPRRGTRNQHLWNLAIDHETNHVLRTQGFRLPAGVVHFPRFADKNAETVYAALRDGKLAERSRGRLADVHAPTTRAESGRSTEPDSDDEATGDSPGDPSAVRAGEPDQESQQRVIDPDYAPCGNPNVWRQWPRQVVAAAQMHRRFHGRQPGWMAGLLDLAGSPSVPWQEVLRRFTERCFREQYLWTRPNRRFIGQGLYLPGRHGNRLRLAIGLDVSGSTLEQLPRFMAELNGILRAFERFEVRIVACDTRIVFDRRFDENDPPPPRLDIRESGGGTDLQPVFDAVAADDHAALVFLTDGVADTPTRPRYPVLWALTDNGEPPADWGEAVRLDPPERV